MFKWVSWVLRIAATGILLSFLCIWTTGYIVNSYMETLIKQFDLPLETQPLALSGMWGTLWGADKTPSKEASEEPTKGDNEDEPQQTKSAETNASDEPSNSPSVTDSPASASPTPSDQVEPGTVDAPDDAIPVTGVEIDEKVLTDAERQALYATVVSKLDAEQLQLLSEAIDGGATPEKLSELKTMLQTALTPAEYAQMMEVLAGAS